MENTLGLVMTGGGARGAYQAGVLKRIGEIKRIRTHGNPFPIIGGSSAGAVNGAALAAGCDDFPLATQVLAGLWSRLKPTDIFRCDVLSQARNSMTWILDLSFGAVLGGGNARSLLDASPLQRYLYAHLNCDRIQDNIKRGHLYASLNFCDQLQLRQKLPLHSRCQRPPNVEPEPPRDPGDQDNGRSHLRFGRHSSSFSASKAQNSQRHGLLRRRVRTPSATSQSYHTAGSPEGFRNRGPL